MTTTDVKKSVQFQRTVRVKIIRKPTQEDVSEAWYSDSEYAGFKEQVKDDAKEIVRRLGADRVVNYFKHVGNDGANSDLSLEDFSSLLGLDRCFPVRSKARRQSRFMVWDTVCFFQENGADQDTIAENCAQMSLQSITHAYRVAVRSFVLTETSRTILKAKVSNKKYSRKASECANTKTQVLVQSMKEQNIQPRIIISPVA